MSTPGLEDKLASEARDGDQRALAKIFSDYHQPLYRYCLAIVGDRQDAEDALQETMIKVLRSLPGEQREIALRPWLYRIAHNEAIDQLRRRRKTALLEDAEPAPGGGLAEQVEARERLRQLIADLSALPERQRGALLMREAAGLDFDEIGAALETTPAVARQTLYEARLGLREMDVGREMECAAVTKALSDGDRRVQRRRDIRAHLRACPSCRGFVEEIDGRRGNLAAITPLPSVAAAALLHGVIAGGSGGAGVAVGAGAAGKAGASGAGGVGAIAAGSAAKSVGTVTLLKGAATVAVVAAVGAVVADKGGLVHFGDHGATPAPRSSSSTQPDGGNPGAARRGDENAAGGAAGLRSASRVKAARARTRRQLGTATAASPRPQSRPAAESASPPPANPESGKAEVRTPPQAAHGQETAAANHAAHEDEKVPPDKAATEHPAHPAHPAHPVHPEKPETPAKEAEAPPVTEAPPASAAEHAANPPGQSK